MGNKIKIKKATVKDIDLFWPLFSESIKKQFPEYSKKAKDYFLRKAFSKKELKKDLKGENLIIFLAFSGKEIVGFLVALPPYGGISFVSWLAVKDNFQGKGIGGQLLKKQEAVVKGQGVHKIHLWTDRRNLKFYKRKGYKMVGCIPKNYFGSDDWLFYKTIQAPKRWI